jgi:hypothetical protein
VTRHGFLLHQLAYLFIVNCSANPASLPPAWLQVSWLGAWTLLLGFRDFKTIDDMESGLPCLRSEEADMLEVARLWARISAAAEVRCRCQGSRS